MQVLHAVFVSTILVNIFFLVAAKEILMIEHRPWNLVKLNFNVYSFRDIIENLASLGEIKCILEFCFL